MRRPGAQGGGMAHVVLLASRSPQRALLLREGVRFAPGGAVNLSTYGWPSEAYDSAAASHKRAASTRRSRRLKGLRT